eukprot:TRINITY_DN1410_c0_g1_i8.p1 TRINITY_DN1410_c0_g1~~TRINITY_DN1410_c0_g1_i8.p1  ORF type:complete len:676 (+),score=199.21 TRINITY_DN1410_c0_g1_i8:76-2103(+)
MCIRDRVSTQSTWGIITKPVSIYKHQPKANRKMESEVETRFSEQDYQDLKQANAGLEHRVSTLNQKVDALTANNRELDEKNQELSSELSGLKQRCSDIEMELQTKTKEIDLLTKENQALKLTIPDIVSDDKAEKKTLLEKIMKIQIPRVELDDCKRRNEKLEILNADLGIQLAEAQKKLKQMELKVKDAQNVSNIFNPKYDETAVSEYDVVVKINSLSDLSRDGWTVKASQRYCELEQESTIVVAATGLSNKGKTYIINKLCNENFASGFHVKTEGLSMICGTRKGRVISFLDTAGYETPIPFFNDKHIAKSKGPVTEDEEKAQEENYKNKMNDRNATEDFLQNFIVETCNVILLVVSQLTYSDQRMLSRITEKYKHKRILIIHNLHDICYREDVERLIKTDIIEAFPVEEQPAQIDFPDRNKRIWITRAKENKDLQPVRHLVMARDKTEAGDYFNESCLEYIRSVLVAEATFQQYNLTDAVTDYAEKNLADYAERGSSKQNQYEIEYDRTQQALRLRGGQPFAVKQVYFDARGELMKVARSNEFRPEYTVVDFDDRLEVLLDIPGSLNRFKPTFDSSASTKGNDLQYLKIEGKRSFGDQIKEKGNPLQGNRKEGEINISIPLIPSSKNRLRAIIKEKFVYKDGVACITIAKTTPEPEEEDWVIPGKQTQLMELM